MSNQKEVTLFLIEDDDVDAMSIERALLKSRIANPVIRAKDGLEAIAMLESEKVTKPFVILLDLQMPRMNGIEFLQSIRNHPVYNSAVVFILTTSQSPQDIDESYKNQVAGYFTKESAGNEFGQIAAMLKGYWKIVYLPED